MGVWDDAAPELEGGLDLIAQDATLGVRARSAGGSRTRPTYTTTNHAVRIIDNGQVTDATQDAGGLVVNRTRHRVRVLTKQGVPAPERGNSLTFGGKAFTINEAMRTSPGGVDLIYTAYLDAQ